MQNVETAPTPKLEPSRSVPKADLDRSFAKGIAWTSIVTWSTQILSWGSTIFVVHYLTPSDYGIVGMAGLYLAFVSMVSEMGLGAAIVQFRNLTEHEIKQFNSVSVLAGVACLLLSMAMAVPLAHFFREPRLAMVVVVMSSSFLITSFRVVPQALLERSLQFRKIATVDGFQSVIRAIACLTMAANGFGYWSLALTGVISATLYAILMVWQRPTGFARPHLATIKKPLTFSSHLLIARLSWFGYSNSDFAVIGRVLGDTALGAYTLGWQLSGMAVEKITVLVGRVTPAFFSAVQHDHAELRRYLLLLTEALALLTFPVAVGTALIAPEVVQLALGPQWTGAIVPLQLLAILATFRSVIPLIPGVLAAIGESRLNMNNGLMTLLVLPPAFYVCSRQWGIAGVAAAWLILGPVLFSPCLLATLRRIDLPARKYFGALWPATNACLVMTIVVLGVEYEFLRQAPVYVSLIAKIAVGGVAYAGTLVALHGKHLSVLTELRRVVRSRPPASPVTGEPVPARTPEAETAGVV